eukprot:TRINITY_DN17107_c0_g1_i1.p2 TRINITY_DN17107_c0_g1~~TRINITY_DN17107_c0_g1_i1.p2  ORF type:complete len:76 (-),score=15.08 TRINITY_DN17107_c0_g1_i1:461-688(-)
MGYSMLVGVRYVRQYRNVPGAEEPVNIRLPSAAGSRLVSSDRHGDDDDSFVVAGDRHSSVNPSGMGNIKSNKWIT